MKKLLISSIIVLSSVFATVSFADDSMTSGGTSVEANTPAGTVKTHTKTHTTKMHHHGKTKAKVDTTTTTTETN